MFLFVVVFMMLGWGRVKVGMGGMNPVSYAF